MHTYILIPPACLVNISKEDLGDNFPDRGAVRHKLAIHSKDMNVYKYLMYNFMHLKSAYYLCKTVLT